MILTKSREKLDSGSVLTQRWPIFRVESHQANFPMYLPLKFGSVKMFYVL